MAEGRSQRIRQPLGLTICRLRVSLVWLRSIQGFLVAKGLKSMCGITGFIDAERSKENAEQLIDRMCQVIRHRGPDDQGVWVGDGVALGMRRLSIIDLAGGHQPIFNEDQSILVILNGEIYNYRELQKDLQERGHRFHTNSDTEAIVHAYE